MNLQTGPNSLLVGRTAQLTRRRRYSQDAKPETSDTHHQSEPVWSSAALTSDQNTPSNQPAQDRREEITAGSTDDATKVSLIALMNGCRDTRQSSSCLVDCPYPRGNPSRSQKLGI